MKVDSDACDLVVLFADADAQAFFERVIEAGIERRCTGAFRWRSIRDPRRDASVAQDAAGTLGPLVDPNRRFLVIWDQHGSGQEQEEGAAARHKVIDGLVRRGATETFVHAARLEPELEAVFVPVWERVKEIVAGIRKRPPPTDVAVLGLARRHLPHATTAPPDIDALLSVHPKEALHGLLEAVQLRWSPSVHQRLGEQLSIPRMKSDPVFGSVAEQLRTWFPPPDNETE